MINNCIAYVFILRVNFFGESLVRDKISVHYKNIILKCTAGQNVAPPVIPKSAQKISLKIIWLYSIMCNNKMFLIFLPGQ